MKLDEDYCVVTALLFEGKVHGVIPFDYWIGYYEIDGALICVTGLKFDASVKVRRTEMK